MMNIAESPQSILPKKPLLKYEKSRQDAAKVKLEQAEDSFRKLDVEFAGALDDKVMKKVLSGLDIPAEGVKKRSRKRSSFVRTITGGMLGTKKSINKEALAEMKKMQKNSGPIKLETFLAWYRKELDDDDSTPRREGTTNELGK